MAYITVAMCTAMIGRNRYMERPVGHNGYMERPVGRCDEVYGNIYLGSVLL